MGVGFAGDGCLLWASRLYDRNISPTCVPVGQRNRQPLPGLCSTFRTLFPSSRSISGLAAYVPRKENFELVSCSGVEVDGDSTVLGRVISGPLAHARGSVPWDIKGGTLD